MVCKDFHLVVNDRLHEPKPVVFEAHGEALFVDAARAAVEENGLSWAGVSDLGIVLSFVDPGDEALYFVIDPSDSNNDIYRLFGNELSAVPPTIGLATGGFGGGDELVQIWNVADALLHQALDAVGIASMMLGLMKAQRAVRHREARDAVKAWAASGTIPDELISAVQQGVSWEPREFKAQFGTDEFRSAELLRAAGFVFVPTLHDPSDGFWARDYDLPGGSV